jgi:hypothetical protein
MNEHTYLAAIASRASKVTKVQGQWLLSCQRFVIWRTGGRSREEAEV